MGEAFRDGERLGEAFGATKAEVLKTLEERHPDADEIRIRAAQAQERLAGRERESMDPREPLERFFAFAHLPPHLMAVSKPFGELAAHIITTLPRNPERTVALRKLLEAKDCAVRSLL
jgi:hypothetical protein